MPDENTKDLTDSEKLTRILSELADLREWRATVDTFIKDRLPDTRPLHDRTVKEMIETRDMLLAAMRQIKDEIAVLAISSVEVQGAQRGLASRVSEIERRIA